MTNDINVLPPKHDEVLHALARIAMMRDYPGEHTSDWVPSWVGDLVYNGTVPSSHTEDYLRNNNLIVWSDGWRLTTAGWSVLEAAKPKEP